MFPLQVRDKVDYIASECSPHHVDFKLGELNAIIEAAQRLRVTTAAMFSEDELKRLTNDIVSLKILKMNQEAKRFLVENLIEKGVDRAIFEQ